MGCWVLEKAGDAETASKRDGIVHLGTSPQPGPVGLTLASLFIRKQYQGQGMGRRAMDLLEEAAVREYHAKWITLDTAAHLITRDAATGLDTEDFSKPNPVLAWYAARGYARYRVGGADPWESSD
jgi:GNAT superfamily N-acetyltransferase